MVQHTAIFSYKKADQKNDAIFNDLERPYPKFQGHAIL